MSEHSISVLISHSWKDKLIAEKIADELGKFCNVWMDYRNLKPGDDIQSVIDESLSRVDMMLLLWSSSSAQSESVRKEIKSALDFETRIIPCFIEYDARSMAQPVPPLELAKYLGIDFYHFDTGLARLTSYILERNWGDSESFINDPRTRLIQELDGMMDYLSNYRNTKDKSAPRIEWIRQIIRVFDDFVAAGGDARFLEPLLLAAYQCQGNDSQAITVLIQKLENLLGKNIPADIDRGSAGAKARRSGKHKPEKSEKSEISKKQAVDKLDQIIAAMAPKSQSRQWSAAVDGYINSAPDVLDAMKIYCIGVNSPAGCEVVNFLNTYLDNKNDLIPDSQGRYGYLDDAWLIHNTAYRLIESDILPGNLILLDWQAIIAADQIVLKIIPYEIIQILDQYAVQMFGLIAAEVQSYQPVWGQNVMSGGQSYAEKWYDVGVESIQNM